MFPLIILGLIIAAYSIYSSNVDVGQVDNSAVADVPNEMLLPGNDYIAALDLPDNYLSDVHQNFNIATMTYILPTQGEPYRGLIQNASTKYGVPFSLLAAQLQRESNFNPRAYNAKAGAAGIAQFIPGTAAQFGIDPFDPVQAIDAQARYMATLYSKTGSWSLALAAYNWGIGNLTKKGFVNAPIETTQYVSIITGISGVA